MDQTLIAVIISVFGYTLYGAAGFGAAMIFHSIWTLLEVFGVTDGSVSEATYYLNIMTLMVTLIMSVNNRQLIQWNFVGVIILPWFAMNVLGCFLLVGVSNQLLKFILGCVLALIFIQQMVKTLHSFFTGQAYQEVFLEYQALVDEEESKETSDDDDSGSFSALNDEIPLVILSEKWPWIIFLGIFGGILSGLFNMPGPATIIVLLFSGIDRERFKANFFTWQIPAQMFVVWYLSTHGGPDDDGFFKTDKLPWYAAMCVVSMTASKFGNYVGKYLSKTTFTFIVISLSFLGALSDISVEFPSEKETIILIGFGVAFVILSTLFILNYIYVLKPLKDANFDVNALANSPAINQSITIREKESIINP